MKITDIKYEYLIFLSLIVLLVFLHQFGAQSNLGNKNTKNKSTYVIAENILNTDNPIPIEIVKRKKDRKLFKKSRQEYVDLIHKRGPDVDWEKMDSDFRKQRSLERTLEREEYIQNGLKHVQRFSYEKIMKDFINLL